MPAADRPSSTLTNPAGRRPGPGSGCSWSSGRAVSAAVWARPTPGRRVDGAGSAANTRAGGAVEGTGLTPVASARRRSRPGWPRPGGPGTTACSRAGWRTPPPGRCRTGAGGSAAARAGSGRRPLPGSAAGRRRTRPSRRRRCRARTRPRPGAGRRPRRSLRPAAARRPAGRSSKSPDEAGHAHRQQLRRVRLDLEPAGQLQPLAQQPGQPVGGVPLGHAEGAWSRVTRASSRSRRARAGGGAWASSRARSSSRTASALAPSRWATAAPRSYQTIASSASPARSWWAATCAATRPSPACSRSRARATRRVWRRRAGPRAAAATSRMRSRVKS